MKKVRGKPTKCWRASAWKGGGSIASRQPTGSVRLGAVCGICIVEGSQDMARETEMRSKGGSSEREGASPAKLVYVIGQSTDEVMADRSSKPGLKGKRKGNEAVG